MDFKQLEYFKTIYEEGSISRAAEKLYISQICQSGHRQNVAFQISKKAPQKSGQLIL